jgi:hypothetical protein
VIVARRLQQGSHRLGAEEVGDFFEVVEALEIAVLLLRFDFLGASIVVCGGICYEPFHVGSNEGDLALLEP